MIQRTVKVAEIRSKIKERRLNLYGHKEDYVGRIVPGYRRRGRPNFRRKDTLKEDMREKSLIVHHREELKRLSGDSDPI